MFKTENRGAVTPSFFGSIHTPRLEPVNRPFSSRCITVNRHQDWNEVALSPNISLDPSSMSLDLSSMSLDLSSMSLDLSSISLNPRVKTILGRPLFHWTCQEFHLWMTPV
ncbi:hypothetical protein TNCV_2750081 [Trichonephila clavipes]|nr:hypothetical protein TNCV_2750081 [Trichonephila clavipes]